MQLTNLYSPVNYLQLEVLLDIFVKNVPSDPKKGSSKMYLKSCENCQIKKQCKRCKIKSEQNPRWPPQINCSFLGVTHLID